MAGGIDADLRNGLSGFSYGEALHVIGFLAICEKRGIEIIVDMLRTQFLAIDKVFIYLYSGVGDVLGGGNGGERSRQNSQRG